MTLLDEAGTDGGADAGHDFFSLFAGGGGGVAMVGVVVDDDWPLLSSRLRSSSKTECLASKLRTMSEGSCDLSSSKLIGRAFLALAWWWPAAAKLVPADVAAELAPTPV